MSACMRCLYSSDQWAPGFDSDFPFRRDAGCGLGSTEGLRAGLLSFRVTRGTGGSEGEFELFMQLSWTPLYNKLSELPQY